MKTLIKFIQQDLHYIRQSDSGIASEQGEFCGLVAMGFIIATVRLMSSANSSSLMVARACAALAQTLHICALLGSDLANSSYFRANPVMASPSRELGPADGANDSLSRTNLVAPATRGLKASMVLPSITRKP
jgi:hypothetical protein